MRQASAFAVPWAAPHESLSPARRPLWCLQLLVHNSMQVQLTTEMGHPCDGEHLVVVCILECQSAIASFILVPVNEVMVPEGQDSS